MQDVSIDVPVHVVLAEPWSAAADDADEAAEAWYWFPDKVADGDKVITVLNAREPAVLNVRRLWIEDEETWGFISAEPYVWSGIAIAALELRLGGQFLTEPRTLSSQVAMDVLRAIQAEADFPTPWTTLPHHCLDPRQSEVIQQAQSWGCNACGSDGESPYRPRLQAHTEPGAEDWPFGDAYAVCPSCHDILHQPLGPTFDELMFSHRPPCPQCEANQTFKLMMGMPPGPPPYGTHAGGCVIMGPDIPSYVCQACTFEW